MSTTLDLTNIERAKLSNTGEDSDLSRLKAAGPRALPDNPTANKWSAAAIKRQLYMQPEILFGWLKRAIDAFAEFSEATAGLLSSGVVSGAEKDGNGNVITTTYAFDWNVVHFEGDERIYGTKEFVGTIKAASLLPYAGSSAIGDSEDGRWQIGYFKYVDLGYIKSGNLIFTLPNAGGVLVTEAGAQSIADGAKAQAVASAKTYTDGVKNSLQSEIDAINATQNVVDIVGTKANLTAYDTTELHEDDKIEVLADESQNGANTIYSWNGSAWTLIGSKAPYYSIAQITSILTDYVTNVSLANTLENYVTGTALSDALSNALSAYSTTAVCESTYAKIGDSYTKAESDAKYALDTDLSDTNARVTALETKTAKAESDIQYLYRQVIGGGDLVTQTDSGVALTSQPFPLTVSPKALLDYVGGMCKKCENLYDKTQTPVTGTAYQCRLEAGTYTISLRIKTAGKNAYVSLYKSGQANPVLQVGFVGNYSTSSSYTGIASSTFTLTEAADALAFYNSVNGVDVTDIMLVKGSTAKTYEPYFEGIKTAPVTKVVSKGFNLWDEVWEVGSYEGSERLASKNYIQVLPNTEYFIKTPQINNQIGGVLLYDADKNRIGLIYTSPEYVNGLFKTPANCHYIKFYATSIYGTTYNHDICINVSNASLNGTYMPWRAPIEYPIPAEVRALEGYGYGLSDTLYNYIDFERKMFVKKMARVDLGSLTWTYSSNETRFSAAISDAKFPQSDSIRTNAICSSNYSATLMYSMTHGTAPDKSFAGYQKQITFKDTAYTSAEDFKTAMSGVYLYYELATPVETDISEYIDSDVIVVSAGGHLEFENENDLGVPYSATYQCEPNP